MTSGTALRFLEANFGWYAVSQFTQLLPMKILEVNDTQTIIGIFALSKIADIDQHVKNTDFFFFKWNTKTGSKQLYNTRRQGVYNKTLSKIVPSWTKKHAKIVTCQDTKCKSDMPREVMDFGGEYFVETGRKLGHSHLEKQKNDCRSRGQRTKGGKIARGTVAFSSS